MNKACLDFLIAGSLLFVNVIPNANESHCFNIQDQDRKHFCLATAKHQESFCYLIKDKDNQNLCLAQLKNQKSYCYNIKMKDLKNQCLAIF